MVSLRLHLLIICLATIFMTPSPTHAQSAQPINLSEKDKAELLNLARLTAEGFLGNGTILEIDAGNVSKNLRQKSTCLVAIKPRTRFVHRFALNFEKKPLYKSVINATIAACRKSQTDLYPTNVSSLLNARVLVGIVQERRELTFDSPENLLAQLNASVGGVILYSRYGATHHFPDNWKLHPKPEAMLASLCRQLRAPDDHWRTDIANIRVQTYKAEVFHANSYRLKAKPVKGSRKRPGKYLQPQVGRKIDEPLNHPPTAAYEATVANGLRFTNRSGCEIDDLKLSNTKSQAKLIYQLKTLGVGKRTAYQALHIKKDASLFGTYRIMGSRKEIFIPHLPPCATIVFRNEGYLVLTNDKNLPLYPYPKQVIFEQGFCDLKDKQLYLPTHAGKKALIISKTLIQKLKPYLGGPRELKQQGLAPKNYYVLSIGMKPSTWPKALAECSFDQAHVTLRDQAFYLKVTPEGCVLIAPGSWGLAYGSLALSQLARGAANAKRLPCLRITDWPDLESRSAMAPNSFIHLENRHDAALLAWQGRIQELIWAAGVYTFPRDSHPEFNLGRGKMPTKKEYKKLIDNVRAMGVEAIPQFGLPVGLYREVSPYSLMGDDETSFWAVEEAIDENLEIFRPKKYYLGMDEEHFSMKVHFPGRTLEQWRKATTRLTTLLRRRGVHAILSSEPLQPIGKFGELKRKKKDNDKAAWYATEESYQRTLAAFPRDTILSSWYHWVDAPWHVIRHRGDLRRQAASGNPVFMLGMGNNLRHHIAAAKSLKKKYPNVLGINSYWSGASGGYMHERCVKQATGEMWNLNADLRPLSFQFDEKAPRENWECLLDAEPAQSIDQALQQLAKDEWRNWIDAREQLVSSGLKAAPVLLAAMSKATGEYRDRIEGCMSRNARDSRNGRQRGTLDLPKILVYLKDKNENVRDMAAELIASCSKDGPRQLRGLVADPIAGASCIRALGLVKDKDARKAILAVLDKNKKGLPVRLRAEAARVLGVLRAKEATEVLRRTLRESKETAIQKTALWALALMKCEKADTEVAQLLESPDRDTRFRAALALALLSSSKISRLESWLSKDRYTMELAAWIIYRAGDWEKVKATMKKLPEPKDANRKKRMAQLLELFNGKIKY